MLSTESYGINYSENPVVNESFYNEVNSMNENAYKNIGDLDLEPKNILSKFYENAFKIGTSDAFETLSIEYENSINLIIGKINEYVEISKNAKVLIDEGIAKDKKAHQLATDAKELVLSNYPSYEEVLASNNVNMSDYSIDDYNRDKKAAGDKEYNNVWKSNCWKDKK